MQFTRLENLSHLQFFTNKAIRLVFTAILVFLGCQNTNARTGRKVALIVGISKYAANTGWQYIDGESDIPLITELLTKQKFDKINILKGPEATKRNILNNLKRIFVDEAQPGDILVFDFSGHGQRVEDKNGDEQDGLDEAIVPYDAKMRYDDKTYRGENHIIDDTIGAILFAARKKIGPSGDILIWIDACFSGTITRGELPVRGSEIIMGPLKDAKDYARAKPDHSEADFFAEGGCPGAILAPYAAFSACKQDEPASETYYVENNYTPIGPLSYALWHNMAKISAKYTYRDMYDDIVILYNQKNLKMIPQQEGTLDRVIFGGKMISQDPYYKVNEIINNRKVEISPGKLMMLNEGSVIEFYPPGARHIGDGLLIATGKLTKADPTSAIIELEKEADIDKLKTSRVFVKEQNYGNNKVGVYLDLPAAISNKLAELLKKSAIIRLATKYDYDLKVKDTMGSKIVFRSQQGIDIEIINPKQDASIEIINRAKIFARASYFRKLQMNCALIDMSIELLPLKVTRDPNGKAITDAYRNPLHSDTLKPSSVGGSNTGISMQPGDYCVLRIKNTGKCAFYLNIVDIEPGNKINTFIPYPNNDGSYQNPSNFKIEAGGTFITKAIGITEPYGLEILQLIATKEVLNLESPIKGEKTRDTSNPLSDLIAEVSEGKRDATPSVANDTATIKPVYILVQEKSAIVAEK